jgi:hypothetical protein
VAAYQAAWGDEDEAADQEREVGCEVCGKGAAEGVLGRLVRGLEGGGV